MYEEYLPVHWNLAATANNMLEYRISTYKGQSGSPVLLQNQNISIGAHVYGGAGNNSASPIAGKFGNPYEKYISVFDRVYATTGTTRGVQLVSVTDDGESGFGDDEEGFWDSIKDVIKVGAPIVSGALSTVSPFLGPVGGPVAALAGVAISAAGKGAAESDFENPSSGSASDQPGNAERAILAESTLQAVLNADASKVQALGLSRDIMNNYKKASNQAETVGPKLLPALLPTALHVSNDLLQKSAESGFVPRGSPEAIKIPQSVKNGPIDPFTQRLLRPTIRETDEESIWDTIGSVVSAAKTGVNFVSNGLNVVGSLIPGAESAFGETPTDKHLGTLAKRALLAESALQAVRNSSPQVLDSLDAEGFLDNIKKFAQKIAPAVIRYAPVVAKAVVPVISSLVPTAPPAPTGETGFTGSVRVPTLRPKKSFYDSVTENKGK